MSVQIKTLGDWQLTLKYLHNLEKQDYMSVVEDCARRGVEALSAATPKDTGLTASSWSYDIEKRRSYTTITWSNSNVTKDGSPIAIMLQYGHGTGTGGYVAGRDYINPAMKPVFDDISESVRRAISEG